MKKIDAYEKLKFNLSNILWKIIFIKVKKLSRLEVTSIEIEKCKDLNERALSYICIE